MNTFAACREKFLNTYCAVNLRDSTKTEYKLVLEKEFGGWDKFAVASITKRDVKNILDDKNPPDWKMRICVLEYGQNPDFRLFHFQTPH